MTIKVLFVCMGNICRSPTAEGVFRQLVQARGVADRFVIDSAGTHDYHIGESPDKRTMQAARQRGYDLSMLRGRQVGVDDFAAFDHVLAMDQANLANLQRLCPPEQRHKVELFLHYGRSAEQEVPDPYYGGPQGFEHVLDLVEEAANGLLNSLLRD